MKAIFNTARGTAKDTLAIQETAQPVPGPGDVSVAIAASGVNPSDTKLRSGLQGPMVADKVIIHNDGAGTITAVGPGVDSARIGATVWLYGVNRTADGMGQGPIGTAAEDVVIPSQMAADLPQDISFEAGACLGVPALTAHRAVMFAGPVAGKTVLVTGGAGAVGHSAIQIAKAKGARVIATVSSDEKAAIAVGAGADVTINYRDEDIVKRIADETGGQGVDHVVDVDFSAHVDLYPAILKQGATVGAYAAASNLAPAVPFYPLAFRNICLQPIFVYSLHKDIIQAAISDIYMLLQDGSLRPRIGQVFAFEDVVQAHESVESGGLIGNAVLKI